MKKSIFTMLLVVITTIVFGQGNANNIEFNFGFENTVFKKTLPDNWFQWGNNYQLSIDKATKHSGENSVLLKPSEKANSKDFGCVAYKIPAVYVGKKIELKAYMKLQEVKDGSIGLMLRIDGSSGTLKFDNMQQKNINGTSDWTLYSVKLDYPQNARTIYIGAILSGSGQLWVDDFEILIDGKNIKDAKQIELKTFPAEKDKEFDKGSGIELTNLTKEQLNDLDILGKIWGFLKYYHPSVAQGNYNWDYELFRILPKIINCKNIIDRDNILNEWIKSLGTFEETNNSIENIKDIKIKPDLDWITKSNLSTELTTQLLKVKNAKRKDENYYIGLIAGVGNPEFKNENAYNSMKYPDAGFRLLSLFRYWNIIQYYFPYKNLIEENWTDVLKEFIPKYINASNEIEYKYAVLEIIARVHDTHANIWGEDEALKNYRGIYYSTLEIKFIENKAVVAGFYDEETGKESGMLLGDIITSINNVPVEKIVQDKLKYTPASNYPTQLRDIAEDLLRTNDTILNIEILRNGKPEKKTIKTYSSNKVNIYSKYNSTDTCFKLINKDIAYINNGSLKQDYLPAIWKEIEKAKGLIIDDRNYPSDFPIYELSNYLMPKRVPFVKFTNGSIEIPGLFTFTKTLDAGKKNKNFFKGKVVVLVNEISQSSAEYHAMAYRVSPDVKVIGSTTAGADGNVSQINIPGGLNTMISGIGVYYPDGKETQRVGIVPDIESKPTIEGIKNNKDEVLERAIEYINSGK
ncbi:MAG: peptidase S41 [Bacteroidia bacterium]|nr:peptidase S41 [Bacteroidia bacterium]